MEFRTIVVAAAAWCAAGCAGARASGGVRVSSGSVAGGRTATELTVDNRAASDITIFVVHDGRVERLDRVEAAHTKRLLVPARMLDGTGEIALIGERPGARAGFGGRVTSQRVSIQRCQRLLWSIESALELSSLGVFPARSCA
ncbi:MAG TPA: hypothetical protein VE967_10530 [Gemmatimonadaceae bacterium]|nr:hypothetical protein [Gemmatimonadaceae bacterium]